MRWSRSLLWWKISDFDFRFQVPIFGDGRSKRLSFDLASVCSVQSLRVMHACDFYAFWIFETERIARNGCFVFLWGFLWISTFINKDRIRVLIQLTSCYTKRKIHQHGLFVLLFRRTSLWWREDRKVRIGHGWLRWLQQQVRHHYVPSTLQWTPLLLHQYGLLLSRSDVHASPSIESCWAWFWLEKLHLLPRNVWRMLLLATWQDGREDLSHSLHVSGSMPLSW